MWIPADALAAANTASKPKPAKTVWIRKSTELTSQQWLNLDGLAEELGCTVAGGPTHGQSSWRSLLRLVADGTLRVVRRAARGGANKRKPKDLSNYETPES